MRAPLIAGNWKMTASLAAAAALGAEVAQEARAPAGVELAVIPPHPALVVVRDAIAGTSIALGAQDAHWERDGAFTGAVSPEMLSELGCRYVLCGHSERRRIFCESDEEVGRKVAAVVATGLCPILCVGETLEERKAGEGDEVVLRQLGAGLAGARASTPVVAYEPVWAIGTGLAAEPDEVARVHAMIRRVLGSLVDSSGAAQCRVLYGGSVTPENAGALLGAGSSDEIDGVLVGGASRQASSFLAIAAAAIRG